MLICLAACYHRSNPHSTLTFDIRRPCRSAISRQQLRANLQRRPPQTAAAAAAAAAAGAHEDAVALPVCCPAAREQHVPLLVTDVN
jgi:hypothetical protein